MDSPQPISRSEADDALRQVDLLRRSGRLGEALELCRRQLAFSPDDDRWAMEQALCHLASQQIELALAGCAKAVSLAPSIALHHYHLALTRTVAGMRPGAIDEYRAAIQLDPSLEEAYLKLGQVLLSLGRREDAIDCCRTVLEINPHLAEADVLWAEALIELGQEEEAEKHLKPMLISDPAMAVSHGVRLQVLGRFPEARECFLNSLAVAPRQGVPYYWLTRGQKITEIDRGLVEQMLAIARDPRLPMVEKIYLQYGLGKAFEDLSEYRQAMRHYDEANGLTAMSRNVRFDREGLVQYNDWRIKAYQPKPVAHFRPFGSKSEKPLFVIGMIRSGTTLVEQMLSNHPKIAAGGEMLYWNEQQESFNSRVANGTIDGGFVAETAQNYLELIEQMAPNVPRVVDKMPMNFFLVGPIHVVLPNARFIHVRRSPADTCLSIYTTYFESSPSFANNQDNIVFYYREYERLMAHWRSLIPSDRFIDVEYEELVGQPEIVMRRLIEFCGLPWNDACLHPEFNKRAVRTPSAWQVRQPTYQTSRDRWRHFEPWLGAIKDLGS